MSCLKFLRIILLCGCITGTMTGYAQFPGGGGRSFNANIGHIYGKVIDSASGKGLEYTVVQVYGYRYDTVQHSGKVGILTGNLCKANGDFSLENLPVTTPLTIKISALGYLPREFPFSFKIDMWIRISGTFA
jgi:hypothetical protein